MEPMEVKETGRYERTDGDQRHTVVKFLLDTGQRYIRFHLDLTQLIHLHNHAGGNRNKTCKAGPVKVLY